MKGVLVKNQKKCQTVEKQNAHLISKIQALMKQINKVNEVKENLQVEIS